MGVLLPKTSCQEIIEWLHALAYGSKVLNNIIVFEFSITAQLSERFQFSILENSLFSCLIAFVQEQWIGSDFLCLYCPLKYLEPYGGFFSLAFSKNLFFEGGQFGTVHDKFLLRTVLFH
jgi:hypothetical protein